MSDKKQHMQWHMIWQVSKWLSHCGACGKLLITYQKWVHPINSVLGNIVTYWANKQEYDHCRDRPLGRQRKVMRRYSNDYCESFHSVFLLIRTERSGEGYLRGGCSWRQWATYSSWIITGGDASLPFVWPWYNVLKHGFDLWPWHKDVLLEGGGWCWQRPIMLM